MLNGHSRWPPKGAMGRASSIVTMFVGCSANVGPANADGGKDAEDASGVGGTAVASARVAGISIVENAGGA